ncbi:MAG: dTDP-4-dehydrorhamnose 3,5-epimerase [Acidimicrobiia bacterium]|nr:dTDP-4-dehydrorhamnose 3,5-epimerase [Acidimicrobiia bacterium]
MFIEPTSIDGLYTIDPERHADDRGYFARAWCVNEFSENGLTTGFVQSSISYNAKADTLRGMHFQSEPYGETKLIRCEQGAIHDVILDLRPESDTYLQWEAFRLDPVGGRQLYVAPGLAHGFQTLADETVVSYQIDTFYQPDHATGVRWNDPAFAIDWPEASARIMSDKDRSWPDFEPASAP